MTLPPALVLVWMVATIALIIISIRLTITLRRSTAMIVKLLTEKWVGRLAATHGMYPADISLPDTGRPYDGGQV